MTKPKQKNENKKKKEERKTSVSTVPTSRLPPLSGCAAKFGLACVDPWNPAVAGVCYPSAPSLDSQKVTCYARGTGTVGTNGFGFVAAAPCLANDRMAAYATTASYTQTFVNIGNGINGSGFNLRDGIAAAGVNSPYAFDDMVPLPNATPDVSGRIVSVSLRLRYTGTELEKSGSSYAVSIPGRNSSQAFSAAALMSFPQTEVKTVSRDWVQCNAHINNSDEAEYGFNNTNTSSNDQARILYPLSDENLLAPEITSSTPSSLVSGSAFMVIAINGTPGSTFFWELVEHVEFIGRSVGRLVTPSEADPQGAQIVGAALDRIPRILSSGAEKSPKRAFLKALESVWREVKPIATPVLLSMLGV